MITRQAIHQPSALSVSVCVCLYAALLMGVVGVCDCSGSQPEGQDSSRGHQRYSKGVMRWFKVKQKQSAAQNSISLGFFFFKCAAHPLHKVHSAAVLELSIVLHDLFSCCGIPDVEIYTLGTLKLLLLIFL